MTANLYALFGVTADAHPDVIKAAYRVLAKQYHPDGAGAGDPAATAKFIELQNAYQVLGNPRQRAAYDATLSDAAGEEIEVEPEARIDPDEAWHRTAREHPEIDQIHEFLDQYSPALANRFVLAVMDGECGDDPAGLAAALERQFFSKYFGDDPDVQALARLFLAQGNRLAAKELNKAVKSLQDSDPEALRKLVSEFDRIYRAETSGEPGTPPPDAAPGAPPARAVTASGGGALLLLVIITLLGAIAAAFLAFQTYPSGGQDEAASAATSEVVPPTRSDIQGETSGKRPALEKQIYDRIVGEQEVNGEFNPAGQVPKVLPSEIATPAGDQTIQRNGKGDEASVPAAPAPGKTNGLPDVQPPPLPIPGGANPVALSHGYIVQLASFGTDTEAKRDYARLASAYPRLASLRSQIRQTSVAGSPRYQLGLGPLPTREEAARLCSALIAGGEAECIVRGP